MFANQSELQINDQMSHRRFLSLSFVAQMQDAKTIWLFRDTLVKVVVIEEFFNSFSLQLVQQGILLHKGTIVNATFVEELNQRNTRDENQQIKERKIPKD